MPCAKRSRTRASPTRLLALFVLMVAVPLFWMVTTALKPNKDLYEDFSYFPRGPPSSTSSASSSGTSS